jgi:biotin operon repressor
VPRETTLSVIRAAKAIRTLPDGSRASRSLKHALLVLACHWPNIFPSQQTLADEIGVSRRYVNELLRDLEDAGLIVRQRCGYHSTQYRLNLPAIRTGCDPGIPKGCDPGTSEVVSPASHEVQEEEGSWDPSDHDEDDLAGLWDRHRPGAPSKGAPSVVRPG